MLAAVYEGPDQLNLKTVSDPQVTDDSAILRVESVAVCGSDLRILHHGNPRVVPPAIIGHEIAGVVVAAGRSVTRVKEGDRVALGADVPCGQCRWCRDGLGNNCAVNYAIGYQIPGGFAQYMRLPRLVLEEGPVTPFSNSVSFDEAALAEPLACAINGLELALMGLGKSVAIIGLGPIGCMMIDLARVMGATRVIAAQRSKLRMEIAKTYGADVYIATEEEDVVARCREETGGEGPDIVVTTCGSVEAHEQAIAMVAHRGCVNLFGGLGKDARPMSVLSNTIHYKECFVTGSHGSVPRQHELAVRLIENKMVRVSPLITHTFPLSKIHDAFQTMETRAGMKIVVHPQE
ncbi:MAG: alcohol dehydrogenase catalytic domain-containing protein [Candidatus Hydrogenedentes bacterium]|nr:alcohol dehydrogenase catalytic domain-containing protein [Candidatus Hydrogenedentota bacterium]